MAARGVVLRPEPAAVRLREAARDREPEARPKLPSTAAPERLEERVPLLGREAGAAVDDVEAKLGRTGLRTGRERRSPGGE